MTLPAAFYELIKIIVRFQLHGQMIFCAFNAICNISAQNATCLEYKNADVTAGALKESLYYIIFTYEHNRIFGLPD